MPHNVVCSLYLSQKMVESLNVDLVAFITQCVSSTTVNTMKIYLLLFACLMLVCVLQAANAAVLEGWAEMPMHTYAEGPTEGQFNCVPTAHFGLFLKECEWRFNNPAPQAQLAQLKQWVKQYMG